MTEPTMDERNKAACIAEEISPLVAKGKWGMAEGVIAQAIANERERNTDLVAACEALVKGMDAMIVDCGWRDVELAYEPRKALTDIRAALGKAK